MDPGDKGANEGPAGPPLPPYPGDASPSEQDPDVPASEPPPYTGAAITVPRRGDLLPPETLILSGDAIHSATTASSPRLYELSRSIGDVRESHTTLQLSRIESRARDPPTRGVATIRREIYTLARPPPITIPSFPYHLEPATRAGVAVALEPYGGLRTSGYSAGCGGIRSAGHGGFWGAGYRVFKTTRGRGPGELRPAGVLFSATGRGQGGYDWRSGGDGGRVLAYESFGDGVFQLQVVEELERWARDVLVGAWCLRLWQEVMEGEPRPACKWGQLPELVASAAIGLLTACASVRRPFSRYTSSRQGGS